MPLTLPGIPGLGNLFRHSNQFGDGIFGGKARPQEQITVALDGSGDTDDINEGIKILPATGGTLYIKAGTYTIEEPIQLNKSMLIRGDGKVTKIVSLMDDNIMETPLTGGPFTLELREFYLFGTGSGNSSNNGMFLKDVLNSLIDSVWIDNCGNFPIQVSSTSDVDIIQSRFVDNVSKISLSNNVDRCIIDNCYFKGNAGLVTMDRTDNSIVKSNRVLTSTAIAVDLSDDCNNCLISDNFVSQSTTAADCVFISANSDSNIITDNTLHALVSTGKAINDTGTNTQIGHNVTKETP
tara:strand:+ start:2030 stop:2914 length:885 start_codon:yes stop_codon:yes gene_type:complete